MPRLKVDWMQIICTRKVFETWTCKAYLGIWGKKQVIFLQDRRSTEEEGVCYNWVDWGGCLNVCTCLPDDSRRAWWLAHCGTRWHTVAHTVAQSVAHSVPHTYHGGPAPRTIAASNNVLIAQFIYCNMYASYIYMCLLQICHRNLPNICNI